MITSIDDIMELFAKHYTDTEDDLQWINWKYISQHEDLSEHFISKYQDYVDWELIFRHQILSNYFIQEFAHKVK